MTGVRHLIAHELREHVPFTMFGTLTGILIMIIMIKARVSYSASEHLFHTFHPAHVLLSAMVTASMYARHGRHKLWAVILVGYVGSIGIATFSDCIIPYVGEILLHLPRRAPHIGFIEKWWLVNPLAFVGIGIACFTTHTKFPHAGHVLISTWASLFHVTMALGGQSVGVFTLILIGVFLFTAVWLPCCTSDIIFPLLFPGGQAHTNSGT
ncbi:MAG: hypothetical protein J7M08_08105 [Planctomycetes bacterium]|nr:hypothetical protein [Planctomycetota bacterium]